jgi:hypothetical protein
MEPGLDTDERSFVSTGSLPPHELVKTLVVVALERGTHDPQTNVTDDDRS